MSVSPPTYAVCLIYAPPDKALAQHLGARLRAYDLLPFTGGDDVEWGDAWQRGLIAGMKASRFVILLLSPDLLEDGMAELLHLVATHKDPSHRTRRVLTLLVRECEIPDYLNSFTLMYCHPTTETGPSPEDAGQFMYSTRT